MDISSAESEQEHILCEQGDSDISTNSTTSLLIEATVSSSQISTPFHSQATTSGLNSPMAEIYLSSQESAALSPSLTTSVTRKRKGRPCRMVRIYHGNQFTNREEASISLYDPPNTIPSK